MNNEIIIKGESEVAEGITVTSGKNLNIIIEIPLGSLGGFLFDEEMLKVLPNYPYEIFYDDKKILEGQTDENGYFIHPNLPSDYYELKANDESYFIPTLTGTDTPYQLRILGEPRTTQQE